MYARRAGNRLSLSTIGRMHCCVLGLAPTITMAGIEQREKQKQTGFLTENCC